MRSIYATCNRLLNAETNQHCEFDGNVIANGDYFRCPSCRAIRHV